MKVYKVMVVIGVALALLLTTASAVAAPLFQTVEFKEISGAPLRIEVGSNGSVQVTHQNHPDRGAAYGRADSGFFLAIGSDVYSPDLANSGGQSAYPSGPANRLNLVSHEGPTGSGTAADPFKIVTTQTLDGSGANLGVVQTVSYINGNEYFRQDWDITNNGSSEVCFKAYHAADVYFAGSDSGIGYYNAASGSVGGYNEAQDWFMVFTPVTPADHYEEGNFRSDIWDAVSNAADLNDSIISESVDNGFALQWNKCVQPGETTTITDLWSFGENEETVIPPTLEPPTITPEPPTVTPEPPTVTPEPPTVTPEPPTVAPPPAIDTSRCLTSIHSMGDVHVSSPDGLRYDFQATGDYLLTQSTSGDVVLQARQENPPQNSRVSQNTAAALWVAGDKLEFYTRPARSFYVNDVLTDLPSATLPLPMGGAITRCESGRNDGREDYTILWPDGNTGAHVVIIRDSVMNIGIERLNGSLTYEGLLGNLDGNANNDMQIRNGALLAPPADAGQLATFGESWRIPAGGSLLLDPLPTSAAQLASLGEIRRISADQSLSLAPFQADDPEAPLTLSDLDPAVREEAMQTCQSAGITDAFALNDCTYDLAVTGDDAYVESAMVYQEYVEELPPAVAEARVPAVPSQLPEAAEEVAPAEQPATAAPVESEPDSGGSGLCGAPLAMPLLVGIAFLTVNRRRRR